MMLKRIIETYPRRFHFRSLVCLLNNLFIMVNVAQQLPDSNLCFMVTQFLGAYDLLDLQCIHPYTPSIHFD